MYNTLKIKNIAHEYFKNLDPIYEFYYKLAGLFHDLNHTGVMDFQIPKLIAVQKMFQDRPYIWNERRIIKVMSMTNF